MGKKRRRKIEIVPWMSGNPTNEEKRFIQVGNSLLFHDAFNRLTVGCRYLYFCMSMECAGKRKFVFPQAAAKKYGITPSSLRRHIDELEAEHFIKVYSGKCVRKPNIYEFCFDWKLSPRPPGPAPLPWQHLVNLSQSEPRDHA